MNSRVRLPGDGPTLQSVPSLGNDPAGKISAAPEHARPASALPTGGYPARGRSAGQDRTNRESSLARGDLLAILPSDAVHLDEAALAVDHQARPGLRDDLADLLA